MPNYLVERIFFENYREKERLKKAYCFCETLTVLFLMSFQKFLSKTKSRLETRAGITNEQKHVVCQSFRSCTFNSLHSLESEKAGNISSYFSTASCRKNLV